MACIHVCHIQVRKSDAYIDMVSAACHTFSGAVNMDGISHVVKVSGLAADAGRSQSGRLQAGISPVGNLRQILPFEAFAVLA